MSTTKKGNKLESEILRFFQEEIANNRLYIRKDCSRLYAKKGYYSKDRGKDIIFDIAIEVFLPGQNQYSHLILIECKNYNHAVPVDDIEEFFQKTQQISGGNIKGIIVSSGSFQEGAVTFSKSKGLGLLRYFSRSKLAWELYRSPSTLASSRFASSYTAREGLTTSSFTSDYFDCYCYVNDNYTNSFNQFFSELFKYNLPESLSGQLSTIENKISRNPRSIPRKRNREIELLCDEILQKVNYRGGPVPLDKICAMLKKSNGLQVVHKKEKSFKLGKDVLGKISFDPFQITIFKDEKGNKARDKYTLAHELGHHFLGHSKYIRRELLRENNIDMEKLQELRQIGIHDIISMEWQANFFASCLLLPVRTFISDLMILAYNEDLRNRGFGLIFLDHQNCNRAQFYRITDELKIKYEVSRRVIEIRLKKLGLLRESTQYSPKTQFSNFTIR